MVTPASAPEAPRGATPACGPSAAPQAPTASAVAAVATTTASVHETLNTRSPSSPPVCRESGRAQNATIQSQRQWALCGGVLHRCEGVRVKVLAVLIIIVALVIIIVPQFTNCEYGNDNAATGMSSSTSVDTPTTVVYASMTSPMAAAAMPYRMMKCYWSAHAEIVVGVPLLAVGVLLLFARRKETMRVARRPDRRPRRPHHPHPHEHRRDVRERPDGLQHRDEADAADRRRHRRRPRHRRGRRGRDASATTAPTPARPPHEVPALRFRSLLRLALTGISSNRLRSWLVGGCALLVAAIVLSTVMISRGGQDSLRLARERLGADIVVVPRGSVTARRGRPAAGQRDQHVHAARRRRQRRGGAGRGRRLAAALPDLDGQLVVLLGVADVHGRLRPRHRLHHRAVAQGAARPGPRRGQAVGGTDVFVPEGQETIKLYGYDFDLIGNLEPTGTNLDQTLFMTFQTRLRHGAVSRTKAQAVAADPREHGVSVMVKVDPGADRDEVAAAITRRDARAPRRCRRPRCSAPTARRSRACCARWS